MLFLPICDRHCGRGYPSHRARTRPLVAVTRTKPTSTDTRCWRKAGLAQNIESIQRFPQHFVRFGVRLVTSPTRSNVEGQFEHLIRE